MMASTDGVNWKTYDTVNGVGAGNHWWSGITYGNDTFVAVAYNDVNRIIVNP